VYRNGSQIGTATGLTYADTTAQPSTAYSYTVTAVDAAGNESAASAAVSVTTPGDTAAPSAPSGLVTSTVASYEVDLGWNASTDNLGVTGYRVYRDGVQIATATGLTYADTTAQPSTTYTYTVTAVDAAGNESPASAAVNVTTPAPATTLTFTATDDTYVQSSTATTAFGSASTFFVDNSPIRHALIEFNVSGLGGRSIASAKLKIYCFDDGSSIGGEFHKLLDNGWSESTVNFNTEPADDPTILATLGTVAVGTWYTIDVTPAVSGAGPVGFKISSSSANGANYSTKEGAPGFAPQLVVTTSGTPPDTTPPTQPTGLVATAPSSTRVNLVWTASVDDSGSVTGYQIFRNGSQIGTSASASYSDTSAQPNTLYSYTVAAFDAAANLSPQSSQVAITTPADTSPPAAPTGLAATSVASTEVDLGWNASTDDAGVTAYRVYRNGTQVGTTGGLTYADKSAQPSTAYTYTVAAVDAALNESTASNAVNVTTPAPVTTLTFTPTDDAHVQQDLPAQNFGSPASLQVDNSPVKHVYLKFTVGGVGTKTVKNAKLRLYCVDPSGVGGDFRRVADSTWTQATLNWSNAPSGDAATIASLASVQANTWYEVDLSSLVTGDGTYSVEITSTSSNGADYTSREGGTNAPQLVLTVA
jgi:chitodextrinase